MMRAIWPFVPQTRLKETFEWRTEIIKCRSAEQRLAIRRVPRLVLDLEYHLVPQEIEAATSLARLIGTDDFYNPIWVDRGFLTGVEAGTSIVSLDTQGKRYSAGGFLFLLDRSGSYEIIQIREVSDSTLTLVQSGLRNTYQDAVVAPAYLMKFKNPFSFSKRASDYTVGTITAISATIPTIQATNGYGEYNGVPVLTQRYSATGASETHTRVYEDLGNSQGNLFFSNTYAEPESNSRLNLSTTEVSEYTQLASWLAFIRGSLTSFYIPSWSHDFILAEQCEAANEFIVVNANPVIEDTYLGQAVMVLRDGSLVYLTIASWEAVDGSTHQANLASPIGATVAPSEVELITRLQKVRLGSDSAQFSHEAGTTTLSLLVKEVPE